MFRPNTQPISYSLLDDGCVVVCKYIEKNKPYALAVDSIEILTYNSEENPYNEILPQDLIEEC